MAVITEQVVEKFLNVDTSDVLQNDYPAFDEDDVYVFYGLAGNAAIRNTDFSVQLGNELNEYSFTVTVLASLKAKIDAMIVADPDEENQVVVRRIMQYTTVTQPGAVSNVKFTSQEFDRTAMKLMQVAEQSERSVKLGPQYVDEDPPILTLGEEGEGLMFGADGKIVPGPRLADIGAVPALAAQVAEDAIQTAADRVQTGLDRASATASAASALDSKNTALLTKGVPRGAWVTAFAYGFADIVRQGTAQYVCLVAHTSGVFATDLSTGKWSVWVQDGPAGPGSGDMLASTYDPNGVGDDAFDMANMVESAAGSGHLKMSTSERSKLGAIEAAAQVTSTARVTTALTGAASTGYVDTDKFVRLTTANALVYDTMLNMVNYVYAALLGTLNATFAAISHTHSFASITSKPSTRAGYGITDAAPLSPSAGAVGSYVMALYTPLTNLDYGDTVAGSLLRPCNSDDYPAVGSTLFGTWRCMGNTQTGGGDQSVTIFLRIS